MAVQPEQQMTVLYASWPTQDVRNFDAQNPMNYVSCCGRRDVKTVTMRVLIVYLCLYGCGIGFVMVKQGVGPGFGGVLYVLIYLGLYYGILKENRCLVTTMNVFLIILAVLAVIGLILGLLIIFALRTLFSGTITTQNMTPAQAAQVQATINAAATIIGVMLFVCFAINLIMIISTVHLARKCNKWFWRRDCAMRAGGMMNNNGQVVQYQMPVQGMMVMKNP